jgi:peptidoglycan/LPS O-acetylase OafA/YrhL
MNRTAVYPKAGAKAAGQPVDEWGDKLVKYIPAEVLAFFIPAYALVETATPTGPLVVFALGLVGTVAYLIARADRADPPRWYFYVLAALAFVAWAIGTTSIGSVLLHLPEWSAEVTVLGGVFLIPLIDEIVTKYTT